MSLARVAFLFGLLALAVSSREARAQGEQPEGIAPPETQGASEPGTGLKSPTSSEFTLAEEVERAEAERVAVIERIQQPTLAIFAPSGQGGGSGVVISSDGFALTNFHVTKGCGDYMRCGMTDGQRYPAVIVGVDPVGDVALIKLFGRDDFPVAELGDSDDVRQGDWVIVAGNPFLLAADFQPTVTYGVVSGVHRYQYPDGDTLLEYADCIQTDASINPGNSGGPLFDSQGKLIGINGRGSFEKRGRVNVGVGYAISINQIKKFLGCLYSGRIVDHATLGATVSRREEGGVYVSDILENSDAYRRGLRYGDELVEFGGRPIRSVNAFKNVLGTFPKQWRAPLTLRRRGETREILVRLPGVHATQELFDKTQGPPPREQRTPEPEPKPAPPPKEGEPPAPPPVPDNAIHGEAPPPMPEVVFKHYEPRRGFANYHFNRVAQDKVWRAFLAGQEFAPLTGAWTLRGDRVGLGAAEFTISNERIECKMPGGATGIEASKGLVDATEPPGSGGLLAALFLWRRLLVEGPEKFGELTYVGSFPCVGQDGLAETMTGAYGGVECRFQFDRDDGRLLGLELILDEEADPCELRFGEYSLVSGARFPREIKAILGDRVYGEFRLTEIEFGSSPKEAP